MVKWEQVRVRLGDVGLPINHFDEKVPYTSPNMIEFHLRIVILAGKKFNLVSREIFYYLSH